MMPAETTSTNSVRSVLIIDDDSALRNALRRYLRRSNEVEVAGTCAEAFALLDSGRRFDVLLVDISLPDGQGFEISDRAARLRPRPGVVVMTGDGRIDSAIGAIQHGAVDFLLKPFSFEALDAALARMDRDRAPKSLQDVDGAKELSIEQWRASYAPDVLGAHPLIVEVLEVLQRVADTDVSVLITGDSGTGKELVARAIHAASGRNTTMVTINCAAIPEPLLETELFGHVRGAFTGAVEQRLGRFVAADGGTIFLDEIGELPLGLQAKILRVIQEKVVTPVGASSSQHIDVRVIAATNRNLDDMVETGRFREDLYYRLNVIPVHVPALRERREDIPELVDHFIARINEQRNRSITGINPEALSRMVAFDWPGNIRQLENSLERMVVIRSSGVLGLNDLPKRIQAATSWSSTDALVPALPPTGIDLQQALEDIETALMLQALERTGWNKNQAARVLRLNRTTLVQKLKKRGMTQPPKTKRNPAGGAF